MDFSWNLLFTDCKHMIEQTLVIIKPDGVQRGLLGEVIRRFERAGLKIVGMKKVGIELQVKLTVVKNRKKQDESTHIHRRIRQP